ncbi:MAG: radical SAM protein [Candidatus Saelkia tenebricola]|nr:radical SAM protein [Candidatus Saelkia tenebricola]
MKISQFYSLLSFVLGRPRPVYVHYGITHRCNLACRMCKVTEDKFEKELSVIEIKKMAKNLSDSGILYISIGGGEPLLRDDIVTVVEIFEQESIKVRLLTNAVLLNENLIVEFYKAGLDGISISLDTLDEEKYAFITGNDYLKSVSNSIELVSRYFKNRIKLLNVVVSRLNLKELPQIVEFARGYDFMVSLVPIENPEAEFKFQEKDYGDIDSIYEVLSKKRKVIFNSDRFLESSKDYFKGFFKNPRCYAGRLYFSISPEGSFSPCHKFRGNENEEIKELIGSCIGCIRPCWREIDFSFRHPLNQLRMLKLQF